MRKLAFIAIAVVAIFSAIFTMQSCKKTSVSGGKLHYDLGLQSTSVEVTIPPTFDTTGNNALVTGTQHFNVDSFIKAKTGNVLGINNISNAQLISVKLTLLDGTSTNNFANFQSVNASFYSNSNTSPYTVNIPNNPDVESYSLTLPIDAGVNLKSYMQGTEFYYTVGGKLRRPITAAVKCKIEFQFNLVVNN